MKKFYLSWMRGMLPALLLVFLLSGKDALSTEWIQLNERNWDDFAPQGKEVDAIYGDYVLRNDQIVVVIARPSPLRHANLTIRNVGGFVLDLTSRNQQNDQLGCFIPLGGAFHFHSEQKMELRIDGKKVDLSTRIQGKEIAIRLESSTGPAGERAVIEYSLEQGSAWLKVSHQAFKGDAPVRDKKFTDSMRADRTFRFSTHDDRKLFCANDDWFRQCYGICFPNGVLQRGKGNVAINYENRQQETFRFLGPAPSLLSSLGRAKSLLGETTVPLRVMVEDPRGKVSQSSVRVLQGEKLIGTARTDSRGEALFALPNGNYTAEIRTLGQEPRKRNFGVLNQRETRVRVRYGEAPPLVEAKITGEDGQGIPCKVAFIGAKGTPDPDLGPDSAANPVRNLHYSHNGSFQQVLPEGEYEVIVSRGPEYDAEYFSIKTSRNSVAKVTARLKRVVETRGWVSAEYHSHSTPSGDNTSDQRGRVLNLVGEHIEFAPCTEHQRVDSYRPHIESLQLQKWLATCSGMELTGSPLPLNHQNAFPLIHRPRTQDGGGPRIDPDPSVQIERLAYWDNKGEKLVQSNHPNLIQMAGDADLDARVDGGFKKMFDFMDVVEVHPPDRIFQKPDALPAKGSRGNVIFNWMQLLNQGHRVIGVVNTDAHYNHHGSGWLRNYVKSGTDEPASIDTMEMVRHSKRGHLIMTSGPFMEVSLMPAGGTRAYLPGDELKLPGGKAELWVRVQCPNWLDVNRVQVFVNGHALKNLNFTRRTDPSLFSNGVVKYEQTIPIALTEDAHLIVATIGEGLKLGRVMGPVAGNRIPCAVSNPLFVDVDGEGFQPSGDRIDSPFLYRTE
ncbi:MAG: CehA/McbA family metallohydrolase [Planctomycetota bacterium]|nr:CehA/McbA family metallohydrolase [Planctomycetota bacterium]